MSRRPDVDEALKRSRGIIKRARGMSAAKTNHAIIINLCEYILSLESEKTGNE
jgi:hypothetical protein